MRHFSFSQIVAMLLYAQLGLIIHDEPGAADQRQLAESSLAAALKGRSLTKGRPRKMPSDSVAAFNLKKDRIAANNMYQNSLRTALRNFRLAQEKVHVNFEKSFMKTLNQTEALNKKILIKSLHTYAKKLATDDENIRAQAKRVAEMAQKHKNQWIFEQAEENEKKFKDSKSAVPKIKKLDPMEEDRKE